MVDPQHVSDTLGCTCPLRTDRASVSHCIINGVLLLKPLNRSLGVLIMCHYRSKPLHVTTFTSSK